MTRVAPGFTLMVKPPLKSVTTPFVVPFSITVAPMSVPSASLTCPVTFLDCCTSSEELVPPGAATACWVLNNPKREQSPIKQMVFLKFTCIIIRFW